MCAIGLVAQLVSAARS